MRILIPNKESINVKTLTKITVFGLKNTAPPTPPVFSFNVPIPDVLNSDYLEIPDDKIESIDKLQFKYFHPGAIKLGNWFKSNVGINSTVKISIPDNFKENSSNIERLQIEAIFNNADNTDTNIKAFEVEDVSIRLLGFWDMPLDVFNACSKIQIRIVYKNKLTDIYKYSTKQQAIYKSKHLAATQTCVRHKTSEFFEDTDNGRYLCLNELQKKFNETFLQSNETWGKKNLIYYTIYFNKGYIELLNKSILSILNKSKSNFDLLLITDEQTKADILKQPFVKAITPKFLITSTPFDGIEASQNKTLIFDYENIKSYDKILFLDCDIICLNDIDNIFKEDLEQDVLYTARNSNLAWWHHKTFHHGFEFLGDDYVKEMTLAKQMPFNAGQFLFRASDRMKAHFNNIIWFMKVWSGEYFFEQAFMNYYFCKNYLTEDVLLNEKVSVVSTNSSVDYNITNKTCLVHFIAPPLDAKTKLAFIEEFENSISVVKKEGFFNKLIKKWTTK